VLVLLRLVLHRYWCAVFASAGVGLVLGSGIGGSAVAGSRANAGGGVDAALVLTWQLAPLLVLVSG
jgi:hypothetical protein